MKRSLTAREWMLLGLLGLIALASSYVMLFYMPITAQRDSAKEETELCRLQMEAAQVRLTEPWKRHEGLNAFGAIQEGDSVYFVQAKERKRFCIFALLRENTIFPYTYQLEYRRFGLDTMETEPLEKAEYMAVRERHSLWQI